MPLFKSQPSKDLCVVFHPDGTCEVTKVEMSSSESVVTESGMYAFDDMQKFTNIRGGNILYLAGTVDLDSRIEAANLRQLRKSTALKRMFEYDVKDKTEIMKFLPWLAIVLLILFK